MEKHSPSPAPFSASITTTATDKNNQSGTVPLWLIATFVLLLLPGCRTLVPVPVRETHRVDSLAKTVNTRIDSIRIDRHHTEHVHRGSAPICQTAQWCQARLCTFEPDTLFIRDSICIERWRFRDRADTVLVTRTDSIPYPVEVPVEVAKPIPRFYQWCTALFWLIVVGVVVVVFIVVFLRLYLRKLP